MQAMILTQRARPSTSGVHSHRLETLMCCLSALLRGRRLTLMGLGRFLPSKAYPKHTIKRVDRLLGNRYREKREKGTDLLLNIITENRETPRL